MKKFLIPVSGARVGDTARPVASKIQIPMHTKQLGVRVHSSLAQTTPVVTAPVVIAPEDYATAEDYE